MKTYKIFKKSEVEYEAVKQGWSWPAFFFNIIWAMIHRMWLLGIGMLVSFVLLGYVKGVSTSQEDLDIMNFLINILSISTGIIFGLKGNKWRENKLISYRYQHIDTINAGNSDAAIAIWMKENKQL